MKRRWHKPIRFFFINLGHIPRRDSLIAIRAKNRAVILGKINHTVNNTVVVHLHEVTFANFLIMSDKSLAIGATYRQHVTAANFFAIWIRIDFQGTTSADILS